MRCQHNHHRPRVRKSRGYLRDWIAECDCGWRFHGWHWHMVLVLALAHSETIR